MIVRAGRAVVAAGLAALALLPAQGGAAALVLGVQLEPPVLDPTVNPAAAIGEILDGNLYEGLVRFDARGEVLPALASRWDISRDGLTWVFHLREGVRFHDGKVFDAGAAKFSLDRARAPDSANPQRSRLEAIRDVEATDAHTLTLHLSRRSGNLLQSLAFTAFAMLSPTSPDNAAHPVGTGPFRFSSWRRGDSLDLVRNDDYWGAKPELQAVRFKFIPDPSAAYAALMSGDVQVFANYPAPESLAQFQRDPRFVVFEGTSEGETLLALNNARPPFNDLRVRRAIAHAVDRRAIIDGAMYGHGEPIGSHFPPHRPASVDLTGRYPYSPEAARRLLAEAGYPHGFSMTLKLPPPAYARRSGEIIAAQLAAVGITARIENIEWAQWLDQVFARHEFDATVIQHAEPMDYDIYGRDDYYFGYENSGFKPLMAKLEQAIDAPGRIAALAAIQRRIAEDAVNVFLFQYPKLSVYDRRVHGLVLDDPMGGAGLGQATVEGNLSGFRLEAPAPVPGWLRLLPWVALALALLMAARASGWRAAGRRLGILLITLLAASAVIFLMLQVMPGDPARYMLGMNANAQSVAAVRHELGLDGSALHRYLDWIGGVARGDLGLSYTYRVPVGQLVADRLAISAPLAIYALLLTLGLAFPLGILAAWKRGSWQDPVISAATQVGVAVPNFWLGLLLILGFAVGLRWVPAGGFPGWDAGWGAALVALTLPAIALALPQAAILARVLRASLLDAVQQDYVRTARAKGLSPLAALLYHALPNALLPVLSVLGLQLSFLLAGAVVIENVFYLPGLGRLLFQAIVQRDLMVVQGVVLLLVIAVVAVSFVVDLCQAWVDPRIRAGDRA